MDTGDVIKDVIEEAPAVIKLVEMAVELVKTWTTGGEQAKQQAEAAAQAAVAAMEDARKATADAHAQRLAELDDALKPKPAIVLHVPAIADEK